MVSTKLVDGRTSPASFGWRFYQVEVHKGRMAPLMGLDRLWRAFDRLDTVPYIRSLGTVAVVGDSLVIGVGGSSASAWSYDVRTKELKRWPQPDWLNTAWVTPPPAFSTDGRYIAYLSQDSDTSRLTVRTWPDGRIVARTPSVQPRQLNPPRGGAIYWRNPQELEAIFPVIDSGPSIAAVHGLVSGDSVAIASFKIFPDYQDSAARRPEAGQEAAEIRRLAPSDFRELPQPFAAELTALGCTIPQLNAGEGHWNVIEGEFAARGQKDWAALCSRGGTSVILVYWGGPARCPRELAPAADADYLQSTGEEQMEFSRLISTMRRFVPEHDAIANVFEGKASTIFVCRGEIWITYSGAD